VFGQFRLKYFASAQDVICEQWVRPSQLNCEDGLGLEIAREG
jgi:hypothetical protein